MICLTITETSTEDTCRVIQNLSLDIEAIECRFDCIVDVDTACIDSIGSCLQKHRPKVSSIATIRRAQDGGRWSESEAARLALVRYCLQSGFFTYVDVEEDVYDTVVQAHKDGPTDKSAENDGIKGSATSTVICSFHSCSTFPADLRDMVHAMLTLGTPVKIAVMVSNSEEQLQLFQLARYLEKQCRQWFILIGMGPYGVFSRIMYRQLGFFLTYAHDAEEAPAPGMLSYAALRDEYRLGLHRKDTPLFGIIGNPIEQTRSPRFHNNVFTKASIDALYVPFLIDDCTRFMQLVRSLGIRGFSVTIPFKREIVNTLTRVDALAERCGAVNTVICEGDDYVGYNTDYIGFLQPLRPILATQSDDTDKLMRAAVLGAGGASSSVIAGLLELAFHVTVFNRTLAKAQSIAQRYPERVAAERLEKSIPFGFDCIVQCTKIGMYPDTKASPIPDYAFQGNEIVYDIVYNPVQTAFLSRAAAAGCICINGLAMFEAQAQAQATMFARAVASNGTVPMT